MKSIKAIGILLMAVLFTLSIFSCAPSENIKGEPQAGNGADAQENVESTGTDAQGSAAVPDTEASGSPEQQVMYTHLNYPYYPSLEELSEKSDYIIYGTVLSERCELMSLVIPSDDVSLDPDWEADDELSVVTIFEVRIKGSYTDEADSGDVLEVLIRGGKMEELEEIVCESPHIEVGNEYIFFLSKSRIVDNGAWLLSDVQALYQTNGESIYRIHEYGFDMTFEQLEALREN